MRQSKFILVLILVLILAERTFAQVVRWEPPGGQLGYNQVSELALVFENCEPEIDKLKLPPVDGLTFGQPSQSSETSIVNWKASRRYSLVYPVRPGKRAPVSIPEFEVVTDKGALRVKAASFTVGDATVGGTGLALDDISSTKLILPKNTFWAGEVFPVTYNLTIVRRYLNQIDAHVDWQPAPLVAEDWSKPEPTEAHPRRTAPRDRAVHAGLCQAAGQLHAQAGLEGRQSRRRPERVRPVFQPRRRTTPLHHRPG
jgi:hypothetical protein